MDWMDKLLLHKINSEKNEKNLIEIYNTVVKRLNHIKVRKTLSKVEIITPAEKKKERESLE